MSHSSGIPVSESLKQAFGEARTGSSIRLIKIQIENDEMVPAGTRPIKGSWQDDLSYMNEILEPERAAYVLFKTDDWILFCYVPDKSKVKEKMLYASSRANLKTQLGSSYIKDEVFGTLLTDFTKEAYQHHISSKKAEAPLTEREAQKKNELESGEIYTGGSTTYVHGVAFPVDQAVIQASKDLLSGKHNYIQVSIDIEGEKVICDHTANISLDEFLNKKVGAKDPRFHFFRYEHDFEGTNYKSNFFVYSCPDGSKGTTPAPVRMRMLYSSSKANVADILTSQGGTINGRLEINSVDEISQDIILETLHPKKEEKAKAFSRPSRPGKGGARLIREGEKKN